MICSSGRSMRQNVPHNTPFSPFTSIEGPTLKCHSFAILPLPFPIKKHEFTLFQHWLPFMEHWAIGFHSFFKNSQQFGKVWFFMYRFFLFFAQTTFSNDGNHTRWWNLGTSSFKSYLSSNQLFAFLFPSSHCPSYQNVLNEYIFPHEAGILNVFLQMNKLRSEGFKIYQLWNQKGLVNV